MLGEIITAGNPHSRRISIKTKLQLEETEYPSSKKFVDGNFFYQRSLSRPTGTQIIVDLTEDEDQAITPDPDVTLINAFKQFSSP
jgi:hypothetical protein